MSIRTIFIEAARERNEDTAAADDQRRDKNIPKPRRRKIVTYIGLVPLSEIENRPPWSECRLEGIRKWATPQTLTWLPLKDSELQHPVPLPHLNRIIFNGQQQSYFSIYLKMFNRKLSMEKFQLEKLEH